MRSDGVCVLASQQWPWEWQAAAPSGRSAVCSKLSTLQTPCLPWAVCLTVFLQWPCPASGVGGPDWYRLLWTATAFGATATRLVLARVLRAMCCLHHRACPSGAHHPVTLRHVIPSGRCPHTVLQCACLSVAILSAGKGCRQAGGTSCCSSSCFCVEQHVAAISRAGMQLHAAGGCLQRPHCCQGLSWHAEFVYLHGCAAPHSWSCA
jgi:hypothetical protein